MHEGQGREGARLRDPDAILTAGGSASMSSPGLPGLVTPAELRCTKRGVSSSSSLMVTACKLRHHNAITHPAHPMKSDEIRSDTAPTERSTHGADHIISDPYYRRYLQKGPRMGTDQDQITSDQITSDHIRSDHIRSSLCSHRQGSDPQFTVTACRKQTKNAKMIPGINI